VANAKNKESMDLKEKVRNEVISARILAKTVDEAVDEIFSLFNVVGQSEQLPFDFVKWYSGMEEQKILNAYKRWQKEKG